MKFIVGVSDMKFATGSGDVIVTHALGSCLGVVVYDANARVGGILHYMLPQSQIDPEKAEKNPMMFGDVAIPALFQQAYKLGAKKEHMRVVIAGGAQVFEHEDTFGIGKRNIVIARKLFWKNNILIAAEHVGGSQPRTLYLDIGTGKTWFTSRGETVDL